MWRKKEREREVKKIFNAIGKDTELLV